MLPLMVPLRLPVPWTAHAIATSANNTHAGVGNAAATTLLLLLLLLPPGTPCTTAMPLPGCPSLLMAQCSSAIPALKWDRQVL
jgi:hypothetical protein